MRRLVLAALLLAGPAAASPPLQLEPSSKWILDYGDDSCRLLRTFGDGSQKATIAFEQSSPRSSISLLLIGSAVEVTDDSRDIVGELRPLERSTFKDGAAVKTATDHHDAILWRNVSFADPAMFPELRERKDPNSYDLVRIRQKRDAIIQSVYDRASKIKSIAVTPKHHRALELKTGAMDEAIKMLEQCTRDELAGWGIDPKIDDKISVPTRPINIVGWFSDKDYPADAMFKGVETNLQFRVNVDASGMVTDCHIITSVRAPEINDKICQIIRKRARFKPAELADGTKVPDYFGTTVVFQMAR